MIRSTYALVLLVCGGLVLTACGKKDDGGGSTAAASATATAAAATATATAAASAAAPADTGAAAPSGSAAAPPADSAAAPPADTGAPTTPPVANNVPQRGIEDCCAALAGIVGHSGRGKAAKHRAFRALEVCPAAAAMVRQGRATRQQALTQVKSGLAGHPAPAACH